MTEGRTHTDFLDFLDYLGDKGLLPLNTAQARKAVANKVLAALEPNELEDITALNVDDVMLRFINKFGKKYKPDSQRTYKSRFETSVADFQSYCEDPVGFRPAGRTSVRKSKSEVDKDNKGGRRTKNNPTERNKDDSHLTVPTAISGNVVPVQIRSDLTIKIGPVPFDLSEIEARRVANVILALAVPDS